MLSRAALLASCLAIVQAVPVVMNVDNSTAPAPSMVLAPGPVSINASMSLPAVATGTRSLAAPSASASSNSSYAQRPEVDAFYQVASASLAGQAPGSVLGSRSVNTVVDQLARLANASVKSYQVLYSTTGPDGNSLSAVTTVFVPANNNGQLIAYSVPEDSSFIDCAPSYSFRSDADPNKVSPVNRGETPIFAALLSKGYVVTSSDYETNELAAFGSGQLFARGVLDGIKATLVFNSSGLKSDSKVLAMGYSGGSIATTWAAAYAPTYAPNVNFVGFATGGTPANLTANTLYLDGTIGSGFNFIGTAGLYKTYAAVKSFLDTILTKTGFDALYYASRQCLNNVLGKYPLVSIASSNYTTLGDRLFYAPELQAIYGNLTLGVNKTLTPNKPIYAVHCTIDTTVPEPQARKAWADLCANGLPSLTFERDDSKNCTHGDEWIRSMPQVFNYIDARMNGTTAPSGCTTTNFTSPRVPSPSGLGAANTAVFSLVLSGLNLLNSSSSASSSSASGSSSMAALSMTASAMASASAAAMRV